jgi:hypothetical protein
MSVAQELVCSVAIQMLLGLPEAERKEVCMKIEFNDFFCWNCGYGTREKPNSHCKCWNDE